MAILVDLSERGRSIIRTIDVILFQVPDSLETIFQNLQKFCVFGRDQNERKNPRIKSVT